MHIVDVPIEFCYLRRQQTDAQRYAKGYRYDRLAGQRLIVHTLILLL